MFSCLRISSFSLLLCIVSACGGGGGNPGTCVGSDFSCGRNTGAPTSPAVSVYPTVDLAKINCDQILALFNNDKAAAFAAAQFYLSQGATQLNGDPQRDSIACENLRP